MFAYTKKFDERRYGSVQSRRDEGRDRGGVRDQWAMDWWGCDPQGPGEYPSPTMQKQKQYSWFDSQSGRDDPGTEGDCSAEQWVCMYREERRPIRPLC